MNVEIADGMMDELVTLSEWRRPLGRHHFTVAGSSSKSMFSDSGQDL